MPLIDWDLRERERESYFLSLFFGFATLCPLYMVYVLWYTSFPFCMYTTFIAYQKKKKLCLKLGGNLRADEFQFPFKRSPNILMHEKVCLSLGSDYAYPVLLAPRPLISCCSRFSMHGSNMSSKDGGWFLSYLFIYFLGNQKIYQLCLVNKHT